MQDGTDAAKLETLDGIAVVTLDNPPVNALSTAVRTGAVKALQAADADPAVRAIVITGGGRGFCAGADFDDLATLT